MAATFPPNINRDYPGAVRVKAIATALDPGMIVTVYKASTEDVYGAYKAVPDSIDTGSFPFVILNHIPYLEYGIAVPWMEWDDAYAQWGDTQVGLDADIALTTPATGALTAVSSSALDITQTVTVYYVNAGGSALTKTSAVLTGTTPVAIASLGAGAIVMGARLSAAAAGTVTVKDIAVADVVVFAPADLLQGMVAYDIDINDAGLTFSANDGTPGGVVGVWGTVGGVATASVTDVDGETLVSDPTLWDHIDYIAYGAAYGGVSSTIYVSGTKTLDAGPLYLDPDVAGRVTQDTDKLGNGSWVIVGFRLDATTAFLSPTPANWTGMIEQLQLDDDALEADITALETYSDLLHQRIVRPVITVANAPSGATTAALTLDLFELDGTTRIATTVEVMIVCSAQEFEQMAAIDASPTFSAATKGGIIQSGNGWCLALTSAAGEFDCTVTNTTDETLYFWVETARRNTDALYACIVMPGVPDSAVWSA